MRWIVGSSDHGCWLGTYEAPKRRRYEDFVGPGMVAYDVGAHVGYYTLLSSTLVGATGRVVAFEPLPDNIDFLKRHIGLNGLENVQLVEAAVAERDTSMTFNVAPSRSMGFLTDDGSLQVTVVSLDNCISQKKFPIPQVIKIDVEGAEARVLKGATELITSHQPVVFLATHGEDAHQESLALLRIWGYTFESLDGVSIDQSREILALPPGLDHAAAS